MTSPSEQTPSESTTSGQSPDVVEAELAALRAANRELVRINERLAAAVEQRTSEMLRARDASAQLVADVNREVRSPLDAIIGYGELLGEDLEALELYDLAHDVQNIRTAGQALLALLDDLIDPRNLDGA
jgi:signal transduction histidine kinase